MLVFDIIKGCLPVLIAYYLLEDKLYAQITGVFAVIGHIFPIFYKFKGGKGVATGLGSVLGFDFVLGLICLLTWLITAFLCNYLEQGRNSVIKYIPCTLITAGI